MSLTIKIKDGTPKENFNLCETCMFSHIIESSNVSSKRVFCNFLPRAFLLNKPIIACNNHLDKGNPDLKNMQEMAWILMTKKGKPVGFASAREAKAKEDSGEVDNPEDSVQRTAK